MGLAKEIRTARRSSHTAGLASLLPIWLLSYAVMVEGFPRPPIPLGLAIASFVSSLAINILLLSVQWTSIELFLYSLLPLWFLPAFDEISTVYKTPFIFLCTILLCIGGIGYQFNRSTRLRWLFLLIAVFITLGVASLLTDHYWKLVDVRGYGVCYPDCLPSPEQGYPWWRLLMNF